MAEEITMPPQGNLGGVRARKPGISDFLAGESKAFRSDLLPYLPQDLIGGALPYVPGTEQEAVWNAASQACATEKVHFCYTVEGTRVWYLACPSSSLASNPDSWCPLAAALPGNSEYWDKETVYLYEHEGLASALRWDPETGRMQVFLGASRTILPRIQSMDANFVTINPDVAEIVPWQNREMMTEKLARATVRILLLTGVLVCFFCALLLMFNYVAINLISRDLERVRIETDRAVTDLILKAGTSSQSETTRHVVRIQELLDQLVAIDGTLVRYEIKGGQVEWEALVPQAFAAEFGTPLGIEGDGRARVKGTR